MDISGISVGREQNVLRQEQKSKEN